MKEFEFCLNFPDLPLPFVFANNYLCLDIEIDGRCLHHSLTVHFRVGSIIYVNFVVFCYPTSS